LRKPGIFISPPSLVAVVWIAFATTSAGTWASIWTREFSSFSTVVFIERATLDITLRDRFAAWIYTGPIGRLVAFLMDLGTLFVAALDYWVVRRLLRRPYP
jgi:hypothetical protein